MAYRFTNPRAYAYRLGHLFLGLDEAGNEIGLLTERHAITVAGSRSGKGAALIIPNLLRWPHNVLCIDPSGENAEASWQTREAMGQNVVVLDPFRVAKVPDRIRASCNLLATIDAESLSARADIRAIADGLVLRYKAEDGTWDNGAVSVLAGLIAFVLADHPLEERNLYAVRQLLTLGPDARKRIFGAMAEMSGYGNLAKAAAVIGLSETKKNQEFVGGAIDHSEWLDDDAMKPLLCGDGLRLSELKTGRCSVFLVLPIRFLAEYGRFLRLFVRCALNAMEEDGKRGQKCLFLLDEFYSLGHIDQISKAAGALPKNGVHLWPFIQDLGQLEPYGKEAAQTFFGNSDAHIFFGNTDLTSLQFVSDSIGKLTPDEVTDAPPPSGYTAVRDHNESTFWGRKHQGLFEGEDEFKSRVAAEDENLRRQQDANNANARAL